MMDHSDWFDVDEGDADAACDVILALSMVAIVSLVIGLGLLGLLAWAGGL